MKQFFKMMFASALGVFVAFFVICIISTSIIISIIGSMGVSATYHPETNTVFKIELEGALSDNAVENPLATLMGDESKSISLTGILQAIKAAKENGNIKGIYIKTGSFSSGSANIQAIRRALIDFKESGKFIVAYGDVYSQSNYFLCSVADKVFLNPQGIVEIIGLASQSMFYKGTLNKLGVEMEIFKVGTYKGAVEPFILDKLSDANREQIESYTTSIWNNITNGIAESRKLTTEDVNNFANAGNSFAAPEKAVEAGFIDELKYETEAEEYVKELAGQTDKKLKTAGINKIKNLKLFEPVKADQIAILFAEGEIVDEAGQPYDMDSKITGLLAEELIKLKENESVKAVVFRVNSPGGSAFVSEQIWRQLIELKKHKPVVVSMGNVAASGGYYISCAANKIVAERNTLTGSIGVFATIPIVSGTLNKIGVTTDMVKTNTYADMGDISRSFNENERGLLQASVERVYDTFLTRCADGRGMTKEEINLIGQGRVWTGEQAKEKGLVDELGGIDTAIKVAAELAELTDYSVTSVTGSKDFWTKMIEDQMGNIKVSFLKSMLGEDFNHLKTMQMMRSTTGVQARLPYDMKPL